jgi:hypothetical protein
MHNPARLLHEVLVRWAVPRGATAEQTRAVDEQGVDTHDFWLIQSTAVTYLREIEQALDGMASNGEDVSPYQESLPAWYRAVFAYNTPWQSTNTSHRQAATQAELTVLRALATYLDLTRYGPTVSPEEAAELRQSFESARQLSMSSKDIDADVRRYLLGLAAEAIRCIDELETFGTVQLRSITFEIGGALTSVADTVLRSDADAKPWHEAARKILGFFGKAVGTKMLDRATDGAMSAIADGTTGLLN